MQIRRHPARLVHNTHTHRHYLAWNRLHARAHVQSYRVYLYIGVYRYYTVHNTGLIIHTGRHNALREDSSRE